MIGLDFKAVQNTFFDRKAVMDATDKATRKVLSKFGAFVMTGARRSIRKSKRPSSPGQPPRSHVGTLRRGILFGYDSAGRTVVIGPVLAEHATGAPETLEYGGRAEVTSHKKAIVVEIAARPYMHPAMAAELPKLPKMWADSIKP